MYIEATQPAVHSFRVQSSRAGVWCYSPHWIRLLLEGIRTFKQKKW